MKYLAFTLAAVAATGTASAQSANPKWVPLNSPQAKQAVGQAATVVQPVTATPVLQVAQPVTGNAILRTGTEIPLRLEEELTTEHKQLRVGQRFHLTTSEPVMLNGVTVIPAGTPAEGEITDV